MARTTVLPGRGGPPVVAFEHTAGVVPVEAGRLEDMLPAALAGPGHAHRHDFVVLAYFEEDGPPLCLDGRRWPVRAGDLYLIAPGEVVARHEPHTDGHPTGWRVSFDADVLAGDDADVVLAWRAHPLLFPFVRGGPASHQRLPVPVADRPRLVDRLVALTDELQRRGQGHRTAVLALLHLLLVDVVRLVGRADGLRVPDDPLLTEVFRVIEDRFGQPLSLRDVARAVSLTPGHLTTVVRSRTGRTVGEWILERRMSEARRLLVGSDLPVAAVAGRVGYRDPAYFTRRFRLMHGSTPRDWRRAGRS